MKWLVPLGFLGLIGLIALLIIYLIKPNFQKKAVSSTYVWKLSLKLKRRKNPINRFQDILLLVCQILAIVSFTFIMAQPVLQAFRPEQVVQKIVVVDASASMRAETEGETRFERALNEVRTLARKVTSQNGEITVILAGETADYLSTRTTAKTLPELEADIDELLSSENGKDPADNCGYGAADIEGAMDLAEEVLNVTPRADVTFYTAKTYLSKGKVEVVNVSDESEYNVAILDSRAVLEENYYTFEVDIASYGRDADVVVNCEVYGANDVPGAVSKLRLTAFLDGDQPQTLYFNAENTGADGIFSYEYVYISVAESDSFSYDNSFYIYGGTKEKIKILYASSIPNKFFRGSIVALRDAMRSRWDIEFSEVNTRNKDAATEGYDFYIYECTTPKTMPKDGVVLFVDPPSMPRGSGIDMQGSVFTGNFSLKTVKEHAIINGINAESVFVSKVSGMTVSDEYEVLLSFSRGPAFVVKNEYDSKVAVMAFELQNSDLSLLITFPKLFFQTFSYFFPYTVQNYNFEVGETITVNSRSTSLTVSGQGENIVLNEFPGEVTLSYFGTYSFSQTLFTGKTVTENVYVKIPNSESDFTSAVDELVNPHTDAVAEDKDYDLLLYFAAALVLLLFIEWGINSRMQ